jgi:hypothetical protein
VQFETVVTLRGVRAEPHDDGVVGGVTRCWDVLATEAPQGHPRARPRPVHQLHVVITAGCVLLELEPRETQGENLEEEVKRLKVNK